jgi:ATP-dependent protease ClpP protease subunit
VNTKIASIINAMPKAPDRPAPPKDIKATKWFRFENVSSQSADVYLYDEISYWGITAQDFISELGALPVQQINLHLNSPGGDVFDGIAIMNCLIQHQANVTVVVDGLAASIASVIMMAGDEIVMSDGAQVMIHDAIGLVYGNMADMEAMAVLLDRVSTSIASVYSERCGGTPEDWRSAMKAESWYSAAEAVEAGLANSLASELAKKKMPCAEDPEDPPTPSEPETEDHQSARLYGWRYQARDEAPPPYVPKPRAKETFHLNLAATIREALNRS